LLLVILPQWLIIAVLKLGLPYAAEAPLFKAWILRTTTETGKPQYLS